jgi:low affinity Fe/Cu permease
MPKMDEFFRKFSQKTSELLGSPSIFIIAFLLLVVWGLLGTLFQFSTTWQFLLTSTTTIITFLMVFIIQNTENRNAKALHLKLDELIRSEQGARNTMINIQNLSDAELEQLQTQFKRLSELSTARSGPSAKDAEAKDNKKEVTAQP